MSTFPPTTTVFNDGYIAETYEAYRRDPSSVDESWRQFFRTAESLAGITGGASAASDPALRSSRGAARSPRQQAARRGGVDARVPRHHRAGAGRRAGERARIPVGN